MVDAAPEARPSRTRVVNTLGVIALWMAAWTFFFTYQSGVLLAENPRMSYVPWLFPYLFLSALCNTSGGIGLLRRRAWGPMFAALAGESWIVTCVGLLFWHGSQIPKLSTPARSMFLEELRRMHFVYGGGAIVGVGAGILLMSTLFRGAVRRECGDPGDRFGSLTRIILAAWAGFAVAVTTIFLEWHLRHWGR